MRTKTKLKFLLFALTCLLVAFNYNWADSYVTKSLDSSERAIVKRIVDGDTFETTAEEKVRMLGINTPEKGEKYSSEAKNNLEKILVNKTISLEFGKERKDLYGRTLAYVFLDGKNINLNQIENGYANAYFPSGKDKYSDLFLNTWKNCIEKNINYCEKSENKCAECIKLSEFDYKNEITEFYNTCTFDCNLNKWTIKDEGRKKFIFPNAILAGESKIKIIVGNLTDNSEILYWRGEKYVWTGTGDTLFLRDAEGGLVLWENY